jgi:dephospho-CoA kinase
MLKVGLTGGIGSGKSVVAKMFSLLDVPVFDADKEAKLLMQHDENVKQQIMSNFGKEAYNGDGSLNRKHIANIVFNNTLALEKLNAIVHPATILHAEKWFKQWQKPYVVKEAALMFEAGSATGLDMVIGVSAPKHIRIKRVMERDHVKREDVIARMDKQIDDVIKMQLCDVVILNDEQHSVIEQVLAVHQLLLEKV